MRVSQWLWIATACVALACQDGATTPGIGHLTVRVISTGLDWPANFTVSIDRKTTRSIAPNATELFTLPVGSHTLSFSNLPANCSTVEQERLVVIDETDSQAALITECVAVSGDAEVTISTSGLDLPGTYGLHVDDGRSQSVATSGQVRIHDLAGTRVVSLTDVAPNCSVSGATDRMIVVHTGTLVRDTVRVNFDVVCTATSGMIDVGTSTTGMDLDYNGYRVRVDASETRTDLNKHVTLLVAGGSHTVSLVDVASNCSVAGAGATRNISIATGGLVRDTVRLTFDVACTKAEKIAFNRWGDFYYEPQVYVARIDGTDEAHVADGYHPSWSPDGTQLVFSRSYCTDYYGCYSGGLSVARLDGTKPTQITKAFDEQPAWSPTGSKILFVRNGTLYTVNVDGSSAAPIALDSTRIGARPAWSPDGTAVAFRCEVHTPWQDICVVNIDGSGFRRITSDPWDDDSPAWSPDGKRIAFLTNRDSTSGQQYIAVMNADGTNLAPLTVGVAPAWSRDGTHIVFANAGLFVVNLDGSGLKRLTSDKRDEAPVWRP